MILRPYQSAAAEAIFKEWQDNDSTVVVIPTGGGKTVLFANVIRRAIDYYRTNTAFKVPGTTLAASPCAAF